jgi:hypothetical protein
VVAVYGCGWVAASLPSAAPLQAPFRLALVNPRYCRVLREKLDADAGAFEKICQWKGFSVHRYVPATVDARQGMLYSRVFSSS